MSGDADGPPPDSGGTQSQHTRERRGPTDRLRDRASRLRSRASSLRSTAGRYRDRVRADLADRPRWQTDAVVVGGSLLGIYALFVAFAVLQGLDLDGTVNTLRRITFLAAAYALLVLGLNLHWGYAGLFNIGVAGFMSVAVFTLAIVSGGANVGLGLPIWAGMIAGLLAAAALGAVAVLPALRLRADYFAIVTLGIAEIVRYAMKSQWLAEREVLGSTVGLQGSAPVQVPSAQEYVYLLFTRNGEVRGDPTFLGTQLFVIGEALGVERPTIMGGAYALLVVLAVVLAYLLLSRIAYSPVGRVLKAIREDEDAARALGKDTGRVKIYSFVLGTALMGLAGMLWQASRFTVSADAFAPILTFYVFVALIVGGSGSNAGSVVGAIAFVGLLLQGPRMLQTVITQRVDVPGTRTIYDGIVALGELDPMPLVGYLVGNVEPLQRALVGVVLIVLVLRRPEGLLGHRKEVAAATDLGRPGATSGAADGSSGTADGSPGPANGSNGPANGPTGPPDDTERGNRDE